MNSRIQVVMLSRNYTQTKNLSIFKTLTNKFLSQKHFILNFDEASGH